jgi:hypothetical protein
VGQKSNPFLSFNPWFLFVGLIGFIGAIVLVKAYANKKIHKVQADELRRQHAVWGDLALNGYKERLKNLFDDVSNLIERYYAGYQDEPILRDRHVVCQEIERLLPDPKIYANIREQNK